jgi:hypothetical protein
MLRRPGREPQQPGRCSCGMNAARLCLLGAAVAVLSCTPAPVPSIPAQAPSTRATDTPAASTPTASSASPTSAVLMADAATCRRTKGVAAPPDIGTGLFGYDSSFGNGKLWVGGLWKEGIVAATPDFVQADGSIGIKFGWWRKVTGQLEITGRRLDGPAPPLRASVPGGYGDTGFQASGLLFPTEGCWEVTGRVGATTLTFVTFVTKRAERRGHEPGNARSAPAEAATRWPRASGPRPCDACGPRDRA